MVTLTCRLVDATHLLPKTAAPLHRNDGARLGAQYCNGPVFVTDYPASIKPFYARQNADGTTAAAFDLLVSSYGSCFPLRRIH